MRSRNWHQMWYLLPRGMRSVEHKTRLNGIGVVVTRAAHQSSELSDTLRGLGAEVFEMPMIEIAPPLSWHDLDRALMNIDSFNWIFFASINAAQSLLDRAETMSVQGALASGKPQLATIGPSTAKYLQDRGLKVDYFPPDFI